jgi:hypothetical protein
MMEELDKTVAGTTIILVEQQEPQILAAAVAETPVDPVDLEL